ncbi:hypothetical protein BTN34_24355 [Vibrio parahaemolyticus]|nr:hypothetical protein BTN34_24355 [Vibrio parahaemolyticus]
MQRLTYKTPMLKAPQQPPNSNDKHFTVFAVVHRNPDALSLKTPNRGIFWENRFLKTELGRTS